MSIDNYQAMQLAALFQQAGNAPDQLWLEFRSGSPAPLAEGFRQQRARLIGLTAYPDAGEVMVCYHYAVPLAAGESVCTVKFASYGRLLQSIAAIYPGAGWQEETLAERFGLRFTEAAVSGVLT